MGHARFSVRINQIKSNQTARDRSSIICCSRPLLFACTILSRAVLHAQHSLSLLSQPRLHVSKATTRIVAWWCLRTTNSAGLTALRIFSQQ
jgi:hypothetical protein